MPSSYADPPMLTPTQCYAAVGKLLRSTKGYCAPALSSYAVQCPCSRLLRTVQYHAGMLLRVRGTERLYGGAGREERVYRSQAEPR
eukprot:2561350-Rhodomonas_salina.1